jgi:hypothetical protein
MTVVAANGKSAPAGDDELIVVVYTSSSTREISPEELAAMLEGASQRNAKRRITGLLLYHDGCFMQAIEGPQRTVHALLGRIGRDDRHRGMLILLEEPRRTRQFPDHSMAYRDSSSEDMPEGHSGLFNDGLGAEHFHGHPDRVHRLLQVFADTQLRRPR